jgi:hypothetical protein
MSCWTRTLCLRQSSTTPACRAWNPCRLTGSRNPTFSSFFFRTVTTTFVSVKPSLLWAGSNSHPGGRCPVRCANQPTLVRALPPYQAIIMRSLLQQQRRHVFSFTGPRRLQDLLDTTKVVDATPGSFVAELWQSYHANQVYARVCVWRAVCVCELCLSAEYLCDLWHDEIFYPTYTHPLFPYELSLILGVVVSCVFLRSMLWAWS